jgi:sortase A
VRSPARARRLARTAAGVVVLWATLGTLGYAVGWEAHRSKAAAVLERSERSAIDAVNRARRHAHGAHELCVDAPAASGQVAGLLRIPALHLEAPVEEGTDDAALSVAVGHDPWSVWPGQSGSAVLLAHDVSYFVHLGQLEPGDRVVYQSPCTTVTFTVSSSRVVQQGSAVANSPGPTLVLDTCYPPNALFFTTSRLLVTATESSDRTDGQRRPEPTVRSTDNSADGVPTAFGVPVPAPLLAQGLTLEQNEAPMGTLSLAGTPDLGWEQSPGPLNLEAAALTAYFGDLHAAAQRQNAWWATVSPGVPVPPALLGATVTGHDAPLDVEIDSEGGRPSAVVLRTTVTLSRGAAPGTYAETVTTAVSGTTVTVRGFTLTPA